MPSVCNMVRITVNDREVEVEEDKTILQTAKKLGIMIPSLPHHDALFLFGLCRLCIAEIIKRVARNRNIVRELEDKGIIVRSAGRGTIVEEMSEAYKGVTDIVDVVHHAGISKKVVKLVPMGVIKG